MQPSIPIRSGVEVIKLFTAIIYEFFKKVECFSLVSFLQSSLTNTNLVRKSVNHGQKRFYNIDPGVEVTKLITVAIFQSARVFVPGRSLQLCK